MKQTFYVTLAITFAKGREAHLAEQAAQRAYTIEGVTDCQIAWTFQPYPTAEAAKLAAQLDGIKKQVVKHFPVEAHVPFVPASRLAAEAEYQREQSDLASAQADFHAINIEGRRAVEIAHTKAQSEKAQPFTTTQLIAEWFKLAVPNPTEKSRNVQVGCHIEEVSEMFEAMGELPVAEKLSFIGDHYKANVEDMKPLDRGALLDSLCDQIVTAIGVAHMFGMNIHGALSEVNRSNYSKFVDGVPLFDANGKIAKPASYSKPNLAAFVGAGE